MRGLGKGCFLSPKPYPHKCAEAGARTRDLPIIDGRLYRCTRPALRLITPEVLKIIHGIPRDTAKVPKDKDILDCPGVELVELQPFILAANP